MTCRCVQWPLQAGGQKAYRQTEKQPVRHGVEIDERSETATHEDEDPCEQRLENERVHGRFRPTIEAPEDSGKKPFAASDVDEAARSEGCAIQGADARECNHASKNNSPHRSHKRSSEIKRDSVTLRDSRLSMHS